MTLNARKFTVKFLSCLNIERRSLGNGIARAEHFPFSESPDSGLISSARQLCYAFHAQSIIGTNSSVLAIFFTGRQSQVFAPIMKSVVISMITFARITLRQIENSTMHKFASLFPGLSWDIANCIKSPNFTIPPRIPLVAVEPIEIGSVNNGNLSLCQRNFLVRLISGHPQNSILGGLGRMVAHPMPHYSLRGVAQ